MTECVARKFNVWSVRRPSDPGMPISEFFVDDVLDTEPNSSRPPVATFKVSVLYPADIQERRAFDYAKYMNLLVYAAETAYQQNQLVNILKS